MARIVPKLNLNKTPQSVDNNSLIFAKNVKLLKDNTIGRDSGIAKLDWNDTNNPTIYKEELYGYELVGYIPYNTKVYLFFYKNEEIDDEIYEHSAIYEYNEKENTLKRLNTGWKYSGGIIEGMATVNLRNDTLLTINEYFEDYNERENPLIPIKTINLAESKDTDDESIYSNAPIIPVINLICEGTYDRIIPNGVYQFFIRYEIVKGYYTNWFPCSDELFTANIFQSDTTQGTVRYMKSNIDTNESFVFKVQKLNDKFDNIYKSFQLGYILSHDDSIKGKTWKHFPMNTSHIRFDYDIEYTNDIDIVELLRPVLNLYNVKNLTNFKNKFYISNYIESDYNKDLKSLVDNWHVSYITKNVATVGTWIYRNMSSIVVNPQISFINELEDYENPVTRDLINGIGYYDTIAKIIKNRNILLEGPFNGGTIEITAHDCHEDEVNDLINQDYTPYILDEEEENETINHVAARLIAKYQETTYKPNYEEWYEQGNYSFYSLNAVVPMTNDDDPLPEAYGSLRDYNCMIVYQNTLYSPDSMYTFGWGKGGFDETIKEIYYHIKGFDVETGKTVAKYKTCDDDDKEYTKLILRFRVFYTEFKIHSVNKIVIDNKNKYSFKIDTKGRYKDVSFNLTKSDIVNGSNFEVTNIKSLLPFQKYNFYIHFVKDTGEITNGYLITKNGYVQPYITECKEHIQLIPKFIYNDNNGIDFNNYINTLKNYGYSYYFFSICKIENQVAELINRNYFLHDDITEPATKQGTMFDCLDIDTLQMPINTNIPIYEVTEDNNNETELNKLNSYVGTYVDSGQVEDDCTILFGKSGKVVVKHTAINTQGAQYFIILKKTANTDILDLIKCTKYYKLNTKEEIIADSGNVDTLIEDEGKNVIVIDEFANLQDYICRVSKNTDHFIEIQSNDNNNQSVTLFDEFISSTDYFKKEVKPLTNGYTITLDEYKGEMPYRTTKPVLIYSTFNLNFLELTNNIKRLIRKIEYHPTDKDGYEDTTKTSSTKQLTACFDSLTLSDLYTFPSMFKNYTRRHFAVYDEDSIVVFNNTIRCSELEGDEDKTFVYKFLAEATYNVPTDKGYIVNLISAGDSILVHTQDSVYKFTGKVALSSADSNVQTVESDVFDTGIQEVVGSRYGFAGLKNKYNTLLSQFGYIFWDADCNVIYAYTGEGQISPISDPINKVMRYKNIVDIRFSEDYYNDRFFTQITYFDNSKLVLSYNIKAKSFISLHDFAFDKTFNTKCNTYFIKDNNLYKLDNNIVGYDNLITIDSVYPTFKIDTKPNKPYAVIDIIVNDAYEFIKTLDSISWICSEIDNLHIFPKGDGYLFLAEEKLDRTYPGTKLRIYTDSCASELFDIDKASNDYGFYKRLIDGEYYDEPQYDIPLIHQRDKSNAISESYKLPRYNLGKWSFNYFRNILNNKNISMDEQNRNIVRSDNNSLIYGKYFVFRFMFDVDVNFKFENLITNINDNYGNN